MAVFQTIRKLFVPPSAAEPAFIVPAAATTYKVRLLTSAHLEEVMRLNLRCFRNGENYTKHTFSYLLSAPGTLSYRTVTADGEMAGFAFVMINDNGSAHLTTIGVAPEHRRRGIAVRLLAHIETSLKAKGIETVVLEVRVGNTDAQELYRASDYTIVQRIANYYNNGEDCYLMMKSLSVANV
ncbi:MAG TPA: ribosomal protein S18-alanine N-acetyltransferase [Pyrinomonadaceae bacterium]|nr:ribosomal protein S18-alanine N-acetyltransferase [Pyrinomonadaceae bacterium]